MKFVKVISFKSSCYPVLNIIITVTANGRTKKECIIEKSNWVLLELKSFFNTLASSPGPFQHVTLKSRASFQCATLKSQEWAWEERLECLTLSPLHAIISTRLKENN